MPTHRCVLCRRTPAELALFGKPLCEECAHNVVADAAADHRERVAVSEASRRPLPVIERDGVPGMMIGGEFVPTTAYVLANGR